MKTELKPFQIQISDEVLQDLNDRLKATRWAPDLNNEDNSYGLSNSYLKEIVDHWINKYDWRANEKVLNSFNQHRVEIDEQPIQFIYEKGKGPNPTPIILLHGWPWTYWHWSKIIGPLTDPAAYGGDPNKSFDVIIPSLPGFGFSTPVTDSKMNFSAMAELFHQLMTDILGYEKYAVSGADYGMLVAAQLGHKYASELIGIHLGQEMPLTIFQHERPWDLTGGQLVPEGASQELREGILNFQNTYASHVAVHMLDPQTLAHGLNDSPVGMLAWILQRWKKWSDQKRPYSDSKDEIITFAMIFWLNQAIGTSIRSYLNAVKYPWKPSHNRNPLVEAPAGFTLLTGDAYPPLATVENRVDILKSAPFAGDFNIVYAKAYEKGGHFGPWENPEAYVEGITELFTEVLN